MNVWRVELGKRSVLDWTGLDWTGLDWTGLDKLFWPGKGNPRGKVAQSERWGMTQKLERNVMRIYGWSLKKVGRRMLVERDPASGR